MRACGVRACNLGRVALLVCLAFALSGCARRVYVPVETVRTEVREDVRREIARDSVVVREGVVERGDTVLLWREKLRERVREVHDTVRVELRDTVAVPYEVEAQLGRWQRVKMEVGGWALGVLVLLAGGCVWLIFRRGRSR